MRLLRRRDDAGFVLPAVVLSGLLLMLFLLVAMTGVLRAASLGRLDQDGKIAMAAAQAGIEDYLSRLNSDQDYWRRGNDDTSNPALAAAGRPIQGTAGGGGRYHYEVLSDVDETARTGVVRLLVTGTSSPGAGRQGAARSLSVTLKPRTFLDFAYLSDIEVIDPALTGSDPGCANYAYGPSSRLGRTCPTIEWQAGDRVDGPVHSNDALTLEGPVDFTDARTESSWPDIEGAPATATTWLGAATVLAGHRPVFAPGLPLPEANTDLAKAVAPDVDGDGRTGPGCAYTGPTRIVFEGTTMRVFSPTTSRPDTPDSCLTVASRGVEQSKPIPPVIYVTPNADTCTDGDVGYPLPGEAVTAGAPGDSAWTGSTNYDCHRGTVYVQGTIDGQVTVAGADDVVVTGDLLLQDGGTGTDVAGLIAGNDVWVHHPLDARGENLAGAPVVHTVQAAVLSLRHSFVVQHWDAGGALGALHVLGAIGQRLRGPVGSTDPDTGDVSGYVKDYRYDSRYQTVQPPYFLKPAANLWQVLSITDR
ncbi:MAG TPA: hypothetical protein VE781_07050 [Kineosporiaceae bacterium]|nr:hypothetical protein [Kineosporiaceae bacterium]